MALTGLHEDSRHTSGNIGYFIVSLSLLIAQFNGFLTVHHSVELNFNQLNAQFYLFNNNIIS
jgi:hypothetical protein